MFEVVKNFFSNPRYDDLMPVVIPTSIVTHKMWPGPSKRWNEELSVTWAHFQEPHSTLYLTNDEFSRFKSKRIPFASVAIDNLTMRSSGKVWTHIKEEDDEVHFVGLLHEDGLGPSRLLLREALHEVFPEGFRFCVPERTCAVVFSKEATSLAMESVMTVVRSCFQKGTEPVSENIFEENEIVY